MQKMQLGSNYSDHYGWRGRVYPNPPDRRLYGHGFCRRVSARDGGRLWVLTDTVTTQNFALEPAPCEPVTGTDFTWTPVVPMVGETAAFTATSSYTGNLAYLWDFGDGGSGAGITAAHTYTSPGAFTVGLTANSYCAEEVVTQTIQVNPYWMIHIPLARGGDPLAP